MLKMLRLLGKPQGDQSTKCASKQSGTLPPLCPLTLPYTNFSSFNHMDYEDIILQELIDLPGEIFDIPEMQDQEFDVEAYLNSDIDY